jgi:hypothetical protein
MIELGHCYVSVRIADLGLAVPHTLLKQQKQKSEHYMEQAPKLAAMLLDQTPHCSLHDV